MTPVLVSELYKRNTTLQLFSLGDERILIFASPEQLQILQTSIDFLVDGTFKVVPEVFYQLYIVHAVYRQHVVPVIYALLKRKNDDTYQRMVEEIIKVAPDWSPTTVMMDFEQASINAFQRLFPSVTLSGCYFHLRQSIHRKIQVGNNFKVIIKIMTYLCRALAFKRNTKAMRRSRITFTKSRR